MAGNQKFSDTKATAVERGAEDRALINAAFKALTALALRIDPTAEDYQFVPSLPPLHPPEP